MKRNLRSLLLQFLVVAFLFVCNTSKAQTIDTMGVFQPGLTGMQLVYAEIVMHDGDLDGNFDASLVLSQDTVKAWGDYSVSLAFYDEGFQVRNGSVGFVNTNIVKPVNEGLHKVWIAVNVDAQNYRLWVQGPNETEPVLIFDGDAGFRFNTASALNYWEALHNQNGEPDYITVEKIELTSNSDASLKSLSTNIGAMEPQFSPDVLAYDLSVPFGTTSIQLNTSPNGMGAKIEIFDAQGQAVTNGKVAFAGEGVDVYIFVTALDGSVAEYDLAIFVDEGSSDATLGGIDLSKGFLYPEFTKDSSEFTVIVPKGATSVDITGVPTFPAAGVAGGGNITLSNGVGSTTLTITSADKTKSNLYKVNVIEEGSINLAIQMQGVDGNNSNIDISGLSLSTQPYTIEMWFKPEGKQIDNAGLFYNRGDNGHSGIQYSSSWQTSGRVRFMTVFADEYGTLTGDASIDNWHHVAAVLTEDTRTVYFDGVKFQDSIVSPVLDFSGGKLYIGWDNGATTRAFKGLIDEVRVWNVARTEQEIFDNKFKTLTGSEAGLLRYLNFNLPNPLAAVDVTSNKQEGIITGGKYAASFEVYVTSLSVDNFKLKPAFSPAVTDYYITIPAGTSSITINGVTVGNDYIITGAGAKNITNSNGIFTVSVSKATGGNLAEYKIHYVTETPLTLKHSYTFGDGTAQDVVGDADGKINGGKIVEGAFNSETNGDYIVLPASKIKLNNYPAITLEAYVNTGINDGFSMLAYFGGLKSVNSYWMQISRTDELSRVEITTGTTTAITGAEPFAGELHHYVSVVTSDSLFWYIDGSLAASSATLGGSIIAKIDTSNAWLCYGGWNDPTWIGSMYEFNIYSGTMDPQEIQIRSINFPAESDASNASLSELSLDGDTIVGFKSGNINYSVELPIGTTIAPTVTATTTNSGATLVVTNAASVPGIANVEVTAADGVTKATYTVNFTVKPNGVVEAKANSMKVYPTVSTNTFTVSTKGGASTIAVYDFTGNVISIFRTSNSKTLVDVPKAGMYIIRVENNDRVESFRVIKRN